MKQLEVMLDKAKLIAEVVQASISRIDFQYNFHKCEYEATVWYMNGECYRIDEYGNMEERKNGAA